MSKAGTRLALRKLRRQHPEERDNINVILRDPDKIELLQDEMVMRCGDSNLVESPMAWFTFLINNWEMILKAISALILIFGEEEE